MRFNGKIFAVMNNRGFTLIEVLVTGMIMTVIVSLSFFAMSLYLNEWETGRMGDTAAVEKYRRLQLLHAAVESIWEYFVTDPANERVGHYYPYFKGKPSSLAFVTTSPAFTDSLAAAARIRLVEGKGQSGQELVYEEAPLDKAYIRYYDNKINYPVSFRLQLYGQRLRFRYYGRLEFRFLPQEERFEEIKGWKDTYDGQQRQAVPETIEMVSATDKNGTVYIFNVKAWNKAKLGYYRKF